MKLTLNLPNKLTLGRLGLCVLFVASMSFDWPYSGTAGLAIFIVASLTDWFDGWIARKYDLITDLGKLLDPLADKILISAAYVGLMSLSDNDFDGPPMWMVVVIIAREFLITGLRLVASSKGYVMAADWAGKHKTITQMLYILASLTLLSSVELGLNDGGFFRFLRASQSYLLWIALIVTIGSGLYYFYKNRSLFTLDDGEALPEVPPAEVTEPPVQSEPPILMKTASTSDLFPAFKEWQVIVESLGKGQQSIILRKGGIAEGKSGFQPKHDQFWLLPTRFHQQAEKIKPGFDTSAIQQAVDGSRVEIRFFARVTHLSYLRDWEMVARLEPYHAWKPEVIRDRFEQGDEKGIHCLLVRVFRIFEPFSLDWNPEYEGCKSWVEVPRDFRSYPSTPVLSESAFHDIETKVFQPLSPI